MVVLRRPHEQAESRANVTTCRDGQVIQMVAYATREGALPAAGVPTTGRAWRTATANRRGPASWPGLLSIRHPVLPLRYQEASPSPQRQAKWPTPVPEPVPPTKGGLDQRGGTVLRLAKGRSAGQSALVRSFSTPPRRSSCCCSTQRTRGSTLTPRAPSARQAPIEPTACSCWVMAARCLKSSQASTSAPQPCGGLRASIDRLARTRTGVAHHNG